MISQKSYSKELLVSVAPELAYQAITQEIDKWWTVYSSPIGKMGDELTVKFGETTHKTMTVTKITPNRTIHWKVIDAYIDVAELSQKDEWVDTVIQWELSATEQGCKIDFTHEGLIPEIECFNICQDGWNYFLGSLKNYLETGTGNPHIAK